MDHDLTLEEISARIGEPVEELRRWQSLGLIGVEAGDRFRPEDVDRAKLVQLLLGRGIGLDAIGKVENEHPFLDREVERLFPDSKGPRLSLAAAAEMIALDLDVAWRFWQAGNLGDESELDQDDVTALRALHTALLAGFPEEALLQLFRVFADSMDRVAEATGRAFHFYVHEPLRASLGSAEESRWRSEEVVDQVLPLFEPSILYFLRKGGEKAARDDVVMHVAEEAGLLPVAAAPGQMTRAIVFTDLSSFTPLTDAMGDAEAVAVLQRFSNIVREATRRGNGRVVKQIGDAFMLVFPDASSAVTCAVEIESRTGEEPQFPAARSGVHWGDALYREGDYVGTNVNIASRIAGEAERHQVVVTAAARKHVGAMPGVEFARLGKRRLKGVAEELELFEARSNVAVSKEKTVDPVCGMELGPEEVAARLSLEGQERTFCSDECLRRFVATPERYPS